MMRLTAWLAEWDGGSKTSIAQKKAMPEVKPASRVALPQHPAVPLFTLVTPFCIVPFLKGKKVLWAVPLS